MLHAGIVRLAFVCQTVQAWYSLAANEPRGVLFQFTLPSAEVRGNARDGAAIRNEAKLKITALEDSELVLVDAAQVGFVLKGGRDDRYFICHRGIAETQSVRC
jgi:hypothetical protein